jgi:hypothetical protein
MTMPDERLRAVNRTRDFLVDILYKNYTGISEELWQEARRCLKHYPGAYDMECAREKAPEVFGDPKIKYTDEPMQVGKIIKD